MESTDLVVIGAGPAGSTTARFAAGNGARTVVLEKRAEIGEPVQCAEGVPAESLESVGIPEGRWTAKKIDDVRIISPSGISLDLQDKMKGFDFGYVLERKIFDKYLSSLAAKAGASIKLCSRAVGIERRNGRVVVSYQEFGEPKKIEAKLVVGADGVMSKVGRWAGFDTYLGPNDIESGVEYEMTGIDAGDMIQMFFGRCYAPGGYAWIFPKSRTRANVGLAVIPSKAERPACDYLDEFIQNPILGDRMEGGSIIEIKAGGVPITGPLESAVADNVMLVGDAARQVNPITGGGVSSSLACGKIAGEVAAEVLEGKDFSSQALKIYDERWIEEVGNYHNKLLKAKDVYLELSDEELDEIAEKFKNAEGEDFTTLGLIKSITRTSPKLMWKLRGVL